ncbi:hypothetical protein SK128_009974 [Halocaridina rubra]|uniref:Uncharacterized protein n=1 Tax=Halocaridina rubra TaxID=373956 RepID=A0AAN9AHK7_HALRR
MQYMNPSEITQEFLESFMDFMKTNVSETAREMAQGNQTFIELIDLSLLYFDVIKSHAGGITRQIQAIIQDMMLDPHETFILMNMPGPEPTEDMYCMK